VERVTGYMNFRILASAVPVLCGILGVLLAEFPVSFLGEQIAPPLLALMPIYFWCLVRPDLMSPAWAFLIGVLQDILSGGPAGIWTVSFVVTYFVIDRQRDQFAGLSGFGAILGFATAALVACATAYFTITLYYWRVPPLAPFMGELAMTVLFYVPAIFVLGVIHRRIVGASRSDF
jgi:rod shape-determining protein MreD